MPHAALRRVPASSAVRSAATGHPAYSQTVPCEAASARRARQLVEAALTAWGLSRCAQDATLAMSELVANAVVHSHSSGSHIRVTVSRPVPHRVRVAVVDKSRTEPAHRTSGEADEDGRGLIVIEGVSETWGIDRLPWGKRVWAELVVEPEG